MCRCCTQHLFGSERPVSGKWHCHLGYFLAFLATLMYLLLRNRSIQIRFDWIADSKRKPPTDLSSFEVWETLEAFFRIRIILKWCCYKRSRWISISQFVDGTYFFAPDWYCTTIASRVNCISIWVNSFRLECFQSSVLTTFYLKREKTFWKSWDWTRDVFLPQVTALKIRPWFFMANKI